MPIYEVSGVQYSGKWNLQAQAQAEAARKWPEPPGPTFKVYVWGFGCMVEHHTVVVHSHLTHGTQQIIKE